MCDWIVHLGVGYGASRAARRLPMQYVLLGAVLPDATRAGVVISSYTKLPSLPVFFYLSPFHSVLLVSICAAAVAVMQPRPRAVFAALVLGAATHFVLDYLQTDVDCGHAPLMPFAYFRGSPGLLLSDAPLTWVLRIFGFLALAYLVVRRKTLPKVTVELRRWGWALLLLVPIVGMSLSMRRWLIERNVHYSGFVTDPASFEGRYVELCVIRVVGKNPDRLLDFGRIFPVVWSEPLALGEWVSLRGTYHEGRLYPTWLREESPRDELTPSLVGLAMLAMIVLTTMRLRLPGRGLAPTADVGASSARPRDPSA